MRIARLRSLARIQGIELSYRDILGEVQRAGREALESALTALGVDLDSGEARPSPVTEPVAVAWDGEPVKIPVRLPDKEPVDLSVWPEGEEPRHLGTEVEGGRVVVPVRFPPGYHRVRISTGGGGHETLVICAPRESFIPEDEGRKRAVFLPLYALRTKRSPVAGDYTSLGELAKWAGECGGFEVSTLPLLAGFLDEPFEPSPYVPASRLYLSELAVDPAAIPEFAASSKAQRVFAEGGPPPGEYVDFKELMAFRRRVIEALVPAFFSAGGARQVAFERFSSRNPDLREYAAFRAAGERRESAWPTWEEPAREGSLRSADYDEAAFRYHLAVQFFASEQLAAATARARGARSGLALDLPVGATTNSFECWRYRSLFLSGLTVGAPPDDFFADGQDWGFPPPDPLEMRRTGYQYLRRCLALLMEPATMVRIDHVMGMHRLFVIPEGRSPKDGVYLRYPAEEMAAVLSLESHRHCCRIVGENLGTVPREVGRLLRRHRFAGMHVVQFLVEPDPDAALEVPSARDSAAVNTHDVVPFAGWLKARDVSEGRESGRLDAEAAAREFSARKDCVAALRAFLVSEGSLADVRAGAVTVHAALAEWLGGSDAAQVVLSMEDLIGEERPQNWPGTGLEKPNFSRSAARTLEEFRADAGVGKALSRVAAARERKWAHMAGGRPSHLTREDVYLFAEGTHLTLGECLGAHPGQRAGESGYWFSVWAPDAERVSVIGDFNSWDPDRHPMSPVGSSGIWETFVAEVNPGECYKFRVVSHHLGYEVAKSDPFGIRQEMPPRTASVAWNLDYDWSDGEWMAKRWGSNAAAAPMSVYEVHLGSWMRIPEEGNRSLGYQEIAPKLADYVKEMGFTHVELLPVMEHPFYGSWGYQVTGYFAPTSRYGTPQDFMALVDHLHQEGIGVILDWVPSHFPRDEHGPGYFDGTHLFEHADARQGVHPDWGGFIFNYGRHEVRSFLLSAAMHWLGRFHADGLRTDAVASMLYLDYSRKEGEWLPNEFGGRENLAAIAFLRRLNEEVYRLHPDVQTIAEESTAWPGVSRPTYAGGLGFGMKWDMGFMHDALRYFSRDPVHRKWHHHELTFRGVYAWSENFMLPLSHDEVVHGKGSLIGRMPGDEWQKFANLRLLFAWMWAQPGKKLLFMGGEFAQRGEWQHDSSLDWNLLEYPSHQGVKSLVKELNRLYRERPALHVRDFYPDGFAWIEANDMEGSTYAFLRRGGEGAAGKGGPVVCVFNATPVVRRNYRLGVPVSGQWREILNTDAKEYGGSGQGNLGEVEAKPIPRHGHPASMALTLPPLAAVWFAPA